MSDPYNPNAPLEDASQCPHGNHFAGVRGDDELRVVCKVCGGPRVRARGVQLSGREQAPLAQAAKARARRFGWRTATAFGLTLGGFGLAVTTLLTLLAGVGVWATGVPLMLSLPFAVLAFVAATRGSGLTKEISASLDKAWKSAVRDVVMARGRPVTAAEVSEVLALAEDETEKLLSELAVEDVLRSDVTADGRLTFAPALRIDTGPESGTMSADAELEARFKALEEQGHGPESEARARLSEDADLEARFEALAAQEAAEAEEKARAGR